MSALDIFIHTMVCFTAPNAKKAATTSSRRPNDAMKACEEFLTEVMDKGEAWPFLTPVSKRDVSIVILILNFQVV